jgi:hypothetical protein
MYSWNDFSHFGSSFCIFEDSIHDLMQDLRSALVLNFSIGNPSSATILATIHSRGNCVESWSTKFDFLAFPACLAVAVVAVLKLHIKMCFEFKKIEKRLN